MVGELRALLVPPNPPRPTPLIDSYCLFDFAIDGNVGLRNFAQFQDAFDPPLKGFGS